MLVVTQPGQDTDGTVTPEDLGMAWIVNPSKGDFLGKRSLVRPDTVRTDRKQLVGVIPQDPDLLHTNIQRDLTQQIDHNLLTGVIIREGAHGLRMASVAGNAMPNIPVTIYQLSEAADPTGFERAWGSALTLLTLILIANIISRSLLNRSRKKFEAL